MMRFFNFCFILFISVFSTVYPVCSDQTFEIEKSDHFIVHYRCDKSFVAKVIKNAEIYYNSIEKDLGINRYGNFWTWKNRCKIILFESQKEYQTATGNPSWSGGSADYINRVIYSFPWANNFLESLLPHELTHIMLHEYLGKSHLSLWIDEGIAQYEEHKKNSDSYIKDMIKQGIIFNITDLNNISALEQYTKEKVILFYEQSRSIISFMIKEYGNRRFAEFIRGLRAGKTIEESLRFTYEGTIDTLENLEKRWIKFYN